MASIYGSQPEWITVYVSASVGGLCLVTFIVRRLLQTRKRWNDAWHSNQMEALALDAVTEPLLQSKPRSALLRDLLRSSQATWLINCGLLTACALFSIRAIHNYTILSNWSEGDQREFLGDHVGAIVAYRKALRVSPGLRQTHMRIGSSLLANGKTLEAIGELEIACLGENSDPAPYANLGSAYRSIRRYAEAARAYKRASELSTFHAEYMIQLAGCYELNEDYIDAYRAYQQAVRLDRRNASVYMNLASLLLRLNHVEEAIGNCRKAVAIAPDNGYSHYFLGTAFGRVGLYQESVEEFRTAVRLDPYLVSAYLNMGLSFRQMKQEDRARDSFKTCIAVRATTEADREAQAQARKLLSVR